MTERDKREATTKRDRVPDEVRKAYEEFAAERRSAVRHPVDLHVDVETADATRTVWATATDIGAGGVRLATDQKYETGTSLKIRIANEGSSALEVRGTVVWRRDGVGVGVRFDGIDEDLASRIARLQREHADRLRHWKDL